MVVYGGSRIAAATLLFTRDSKRAAFPPMLSGTTCSLVKPSSFKHSKSPSIGQAREACDRNEFALAITARFDRRMNDQGQGQSACHRHDHFHRKSAQRTVDDLSR